MRRVLAAAAIITATAAIPVIALAGNGEASGTSASSSGAASAAQGAMTGKHVILRVGPGYNPFTADSVARVLEKNGCPATVTSELGFPLRLTVEVGKKTYDFKDAGSAGATALKWCKPAS